MLSLIVIIYLMIAFTFMYLILKSYKDNKNHYEGPTTELDVYKVLGVCILWPLSVICALVRLLVEWLVGWVNK